MRRPTEKQRWYPRARPYRATGARLLQDTNNKMQQIDSLTLAVRGALFHCPVKGEFEHHEDALVLVGTDGQIESVLTHTDAEFTALSDALAAAGKLTQLAPGQYLMPGMVDLHVHAPQWPQAGKGLDLPLYDWLQDYTFPLEARFEDESFARSVYPHLVNALLANGTTSAVYFATVHNPASVALAEICLELGQRGYVGKVNMDDPSQCPPYYIETTEQGLADTEAFIQQVRALPGNEQGLVNPVITPRFVPSCTADMLQGLGELAQRYHCHVQTHCSESDWARDYSQVHYGQTDVAIYRDMGLLTSRTILAHSIFLTDEDMAAIRDAGAAIAHCPLSNMYFANAAMKTREVLDRDLQVGLGTDLAGAPIPSVFHTCLDAVNHSRVREDGTDTHRPAKERGEAGSRVSFLEAYWMATVGGGLAIDARVGLFAPGYAFDALVVDANAPDSDLYLPEGMDSPRDLLEKLICLTRRANIRTVWVQGRQVSNK
ncbi:guanine deaminase [Ferrimonas balearica]|uniref:guanine deaminase n=1 Tax=Ferrimonas balearica TaxID=44012 RepID=UPI001F1CCAAB|nr:guanine deaminase [Ferrimonas balearica]MBY6093445.1 guanine deaminase [Ferrimonas balearica]